ncbi:hypothetical protein [Roseicyclus mahoneyensis]|uniref:Uncharacterized protein n=1 Tax=Roseicyclus mahoneyensis TaxID=164332 RepID=A0A316GIL7_9RHOB|nr:hypothetical protein [Roseicyclus mahoneyensis]PWK60455.1 hypothetical protein C7455_10491 [Roseicyclus mahoneyensis]
MTSLLAASPGAISLLPNDRLQTSHGRGPVRTELGQQAVTAPVSGHDLRHDPLPPTLPAPIKGLGIPPLNTRQVGDFDKLDDPEPPVGISLSDLLSDLEPPAPVGVDLRR